MRPKICLAFFSALMMALSTAPISASASEPQLVGKFGDWAAYARSEGGDQICYVLAQPLSKAPQNVNHGDVYFMVANWRSGAATEQPSLMTGFSMQENRPPAASVGRANFRMFSSQNEAFIESNDDERRLVRSMRAGSTMRVEAVSQRGTSVTYNFSLKGVTAALQKASAACR